MAQSGSINDSQNPGIQQHKITVPNKHGERLVGILHETGSKEIIVLCHGFKSSKETNTLVNIADALGNEGISSLRFDFAGNGESEGSFNYSSYWREVDDLHAMVEHLHETNRVVGAILGHSKGGCVVLLYASKYHDVHVVVNVSGRYNLKGGIEERLGKMYLEKIEKDGYLDVKSKTGQVNYRVTIDGLMDRLSTNMHEACLKIGKQCRVLTVHGSSDEIIPVDDAMEFAKIIPNHKMYVIKRADHGYTSHQAELVSVTVNFIKASLQQGE